MSGGRPPKLTYPDLGRIDAWMVKRRLSVRAMGRILGVNSTTVYDAHRRIRAYRNCPRPCAPTRASYADQEGTRGRPKGNVLRGSRAVPANKSPNP